MTAEYTCLLNLLGAYLREEVPGKMENADWDALLSLARIHGVSGIVGYMGQKYPICPDTEKKAAFRGLCMNTILLFARRHALAQELVKKLEEAGIDHILMKGFVLREYYPVPELRTFSDIDLLIRGEDREKSHQLMRALGYQVKDDWEPVYSYYSRDEHYEFHTRLMEVDVSEKADYQGYFADAWAQTRPVSAHSYRFRDEFHFLYILTHIAKHVHDSGAGIRMYLDVAAFVREHGDTLDWAWIAGQLRKIALYDFACVVLSAAELWFGVASPAVFTPVSEELLAEFTEFTLAAGVFGHHDRDEALTKLKQEAQDAPASRAGVLIRMAFPKAETIQARYTYLQDKPWLLPAAWVHRVVKNRSKTGRQMDTARQILRADREEVDRLKKLMRNIGL